MSNNHDETIFLDLSKKYKTDKCANGAIKFGYVVLSALHKPVNKKYQE